MRKIFIISMNLLVGFCFIACTHKVVREEQRVEILLPGEFIESVDPSTVLVKCTGVGINQRKAIDHARKGCLEWIVTHQLTQTPAEREAYILQQEQIFAQLDRYVNLPPVGPRNGKGKGIKSQIRLSNDEVKVVIITDVNKQALMNDLVAMNVIASTNEMLAGAGRPTLMTIPFSVSKTNKYSGIISGLINSYLTESQWEVLSSSGISDLDNMTEAIGEVVGAEGDDVAQIAMAVGADVYIRYEAKEERPEGNTPQVAYAVRIEAYETTTARMLASQTVVSPTRVTWRAGEQARAIQEAMSDAMGKILPQVMAYWKDDAQIGRKYYIVFKNAPKNTDIKINTVLNRSCARVKLERSTTNEVVFRAQCRMDNLELAGIIDEGINAKMVGVEYDFVAKNKSSIIVQFH